MSGELIEASKPIKGNGRDELPPPLAIVQTHASPFDLPAEVFRAGLDRRKENRAALMEWVRAALVDGVDFGRIHVVGKDKCKHGRNCTNQNHFSKPSLFKPGAEKICGMLGVTVHYPTLSDYEQAALHGVMLAHVIVRCEIKDASGRVVADGIGARTLKQDYGDLNKSLKMAEKSAHIDATLRMAGLSEVFTQDVEDMTHGKELEPQTGNAEDDCIPRSSATPEPRKITETKRRQLEARISELGLDRERVKQWIVRATHGQVQHFAELTVSLYEQLDAKLEEWAERSALQQEAEA